MRLAGGLCPICIGRVSILASTAGIGDAVPAGALPSFGDYELIEEAGRGAMGVVYRARHRQLNRIVALKMVLSGQFAGGAERLRFQAEAEAAAQLDHPNIVPIHEFGELDGRQFYVMRWLDGGPLSVGMGGEQAARLVATVAQAVYHAHQHGVLHRDLKPSNILLDEKGVPSIADFGLARRLDAQTSLTASGSPLGTPAFMSPEQAAGEKSITTAADVWSLGAVLYYLLAGRAPFLGDDVIAVMSQVREGVVPPPRRWNKDIDPDLETICLKCLRREPLARYASAAELAEDLERWSRHEPIKARPMAGLDRLRLFTQRRPAVTVLAGLAVLLLVAGLTGVLGQWRRAEHAWDMGQRRLLQLHTEKAQQALEAGDPTSTLAWMTAALASEPPSSPRAQSYRYFLANTLRECPLPEAIWFFDHGVEPGAFSPDGSHFAAGAGEGNLLLVNFGSDGKVTRSERFRAGGREVLISSGGTRLFNSADGSALNGALNDGFVKIFELPGMRPLPDLKVHPLASVMRLSPDGSLLATASADGAVEIHSTAAGDLICPRLLHGEGIFDVAFNPAGNRLATASNDKTLRLWEIPSGRELARVSGQTFRRVRFSPDGRTLLVALRRERLAQLYDAETLAATGPTLHHDDFVTDAIFSPDGKRIATTSLDYTARLWDAQTGVSLTAPLSHANEVNQVCFSPDGSMLATGGIEPAARIWDVTTGRPLTPWLRHGGPITDVKFSPSGRHLLTCSRDGTARLWPVSAPRTTTHQLTGQPLPIWHTTFSADRRFAFASSKDRGRIWRTADWQPATPELRADDVIDQVRFSPSGECLLTGSRDHQVRVWKWDAPEPVARFTHTKGVNAAVWLPDAVRVFSVSDDGDFALWNARDGRLLRRFSYGPFAEHKAAASPDGRWLAGSWDHRIALWNAESGQRMWFREPTRGVVRVLCFSPDSRLLVSGDDTGGVLVQQVATGELNAPPIRHGNLVREVCFSPDGQRFAVASEDRTARIWSPFSGKPLTPPLKLASSVAGVCFSQDGRWLGIADARSFQAWDAVAGVPISLIQTMNEDLSGIAFLGHDRFVGVSESGVVGNYRLESLDWPLEKIINVVQLLSGLKIDAEGEMSPLPPAGEEATPGRRQQAEATWLALLEHLDLKAQAKH